MTSKNLEKLLKIIPKIDTPEMHEYIILKKQLETPAMKTMLKAQKAVEKMQKYSTDPVVEPTDEIFERWDKHPDMKKLKKLQKQLSTSKMKECSKYDTPDYSVLVKNEKLLKG